MKKLTTIPKHVWITIAVFIMITVAFVCFLLMYKVESTIHTKVKVEGSTTCIYVTSEDAYRIKESNLINLHIGEKVHTVIIKDIIYNKTLNLYQVKITGLSIDLLPNSTLDATIVTGVHSIGSFLFGSV